MEPVAQRAPNDALTQHSEALANAMEEASRQATNEAELRRQVEPVVEAALVDLYGLTFSQIRSERSNAGGRLDVAYGGVVVEFEFKMAAARRRHGAEQALDYLDAERERLGAEDMFSAVVTDGNEWGFLVGDEQLEGTLDLFGTASDDATDRFVWRPNSVAACRRFLELVGSHQQAPVTGRSLVGSFGRGSDVAREAISRFVEAISNRAGGDRTDTLYQEWHRSLEVAYGELETTDTDVLRIIRNSYQLSIVGSLGEFLFALHSYFALTARLVAAEVLAISVGEQRSRPSLWSSLPDTELAAILVRLEEGHVPEALSITNVLEGDVFSWYVERLGGAVKLLDSIRRVCAELARFAFPRLAYGSAPTADLLRELYQGLTTRELRKALGEFLTPNWLAQAALDAAMRNGGDPDGRLLDCTCGTGTFLRPVLSARLQRLQRGRTTLPTSAEVQHVLNGVVGIDLNPVAVVATRMNYLMALGDLATVGNLYLPVWLADSVLLPSPPALQTDFANAPNLAGRRFVELITSLEHPFAIPEEFLAQDAITRLANLLRETVRRSNPALPNDNAEFLALLDADMGPASATPVTEEPEAWENCVAVLSELYAYLSALHAAGRNEVWAEVIENRFAPLFVGLFDLVVGNPPWLSWKKLPARWKERAESLWRDYGLWKVPNAPNVQAVQSLQSSDIATLVTAIAVERYTKPGGVVAFVLPKGIINGDQANRAFRLYHLSSARDTLARRNVNTHYRVCEILDFSEVKPFSPEAANSPVVLVLKSGEVNQFPVSGSRWFRIPGIQLPDLAWDAVRTSYLRSEPVNWVPISTYDASPLAWWGVNETPLRRAPSNYAFGMGFNTRGALGVFHVEIHGRPNPNTSAVRISNLPDGGTTVVPKHYGNVNASLIIPVVRGQNISAYHIKPEGHVLLAHDPNDRSRPLTLAEMRSPAYRGAFDFLSNFRQVLLGRSAYQRFRPTDDLWWHAGSCEQLGADGTLLCVQEIATRPSAAVLRPLWDESLGRTVLPIPNHKCVFYRTAVQAEAYYLAALINSAVAQDLLQRFANFTAISPQTLRYLPMPMYDPADPRHRRIAELSVAAHAAEETQRFTISELIDSAVRALVVPAAAADIATVERP